MGLIREIELAMRREGKQPTTIRHYTECIRRIWGWSRRIAPEVPSLRLLSDPQWVAIFDALRDVDQYAPGSLKTHLCAVKFTFDKVYCEPMRRIEGLALPRVVQHVRILPHDAEIRAIFSHLDGLPRLILSVILGTGMRIRETCTLRVHQVDLLGGMIAIYGGKGQKDRFVRLAPSLVAPLGLYLRWRETLWKGDLAAGRGQVVLPHRLARKYRGAERAFEWQFLFPSKVSHRDTGRWHVHPRLPSRAMIAARRAAGIWRRITPHHLRHAHASRLKREGVDTVDISTLLGHSSVETTKRYIHADDVREMGLPDVCSEILGRNYFVSRER